MKLSVIGAGYAGLTTAACLAQIGHDVICSESDLEKLAKLQNGEMPIFEPRLEPFSPRVPFHCWDATTASLRHLFCGRMKRPLDR